MKKLNKKGFTLVELLAVIVILALLIVVVATTALPAMNNAKKNSLETYTKRVMEQAKGLYMSSGNITCATSCSLTEIMGADADTEQYSASIKIEYNSTNGYIVSGNVTDIKNKIKAEIGSKSETTGEGESAVTTTKYNQITITEISS